MRYLAFLMNRILRVRYLSLLSCRLLVRLHYRGVLMTWLRAEKGDVGTTTHALKAKVRVTDGITMVVQSLGIVCVLELEVWKSGSLTLYRFLLTEVCCTLHLMLTSQHVSHCISNPTPSLNRQTPFNFLKIACFSFIFTLLVFIILFYNHSLLSRYIHFLLKSHTQHTR